MKPVLVDSFAGYDLCYVSKAFCLWLASKFDEDAVGCVVTIRN